MAVQPQVYYYYKQDTNQILAGAAGNSISNVAGMNALLTSSKAAVPLTDSNTIAKIKSIGQAITYKSDVVYNSASAGYQGIEGFEISIEDDQELWVYRGIQPPNTTPSNTPTNAGPGDSNHTQYNAYLHRPYKLYMLTETGSGVGSKPWLPFGRVYGEGTNNTFPPIFSNQYNVKQLSIVGNLDQPNNQFLVSQSRASGSVTVFGGTQEVRPWVQTNYSSLGTPPVVGSAWNVFCETSSYDDYMQLRTTQGAWSDTTNANPPFGYLANANNATPASATLIRVTAGRRQNAMIQSVSESGHFGKPKGKIKFSRQGGGANNYVEYDVGDISYPSPTWGISVSNGTVTGTWPPADNTPISMSMDGPMMVTTVTQTMFGIPNTTPFFSQAPMQNGVFSYSSSAFDTTSGDGTAATGSCQFGLYTQIADYVEYKATVNTGNATDVRVTYTGSTGVPRFSDCAPGFNITFTALANTVSASGNDNSATFQLDVVNPSSSGTPVGDIYATRISDIYLSLSSSLTNSIDGLYIFNQLPSEDIAVTASMFLNAWTGSDAADAPKYMDPNGKSSNLNSTYSISPDAPLYGEGEAGDGPTWPTASINIYMGNYPNSVPEEGDVPLHTEMFKSPDIHISGLAITTSFLIASSSLSFQDCLKMSLSVESGSYNSASIENSLIVSEYQLEFQNAAELEGGDGRVPTFIDNSFRGTGGFSNAPDCQPTLNNVVQERNNNRIQLVEYNNDPYDPSNFQLILSGSAAKSTVPASNYETETWNNPRYKGAQSSAYFYNSIVGLEGGYGKSPVIEYKRAYLAYCDQVTDPYPVVNSKTQFNILYMINGGGDALNPLISPYTAYDVLGTWDNGGLGQVGINQISGSTQFDALNGFQTTFKVGKQAIPLLYSQTSANTFAEVIPIAGNAEQISSITSSFIEYDMSSQGSSKTDTYQNGKEITYYNIAMGIGNPVLPLGDTPTKTFNSTLFNVSTGSDGFGVERGSPDKEGVIELPIITASITQPYTAPTNVFGDAYFGNPGEVFFTTDPLGSGSGDLSDDYMIRGTFVLPSTAPSRYKTKKYVKKQNKKKTKYNSRTVGEVKFIFESTENTNDTFGSSGWTREKYQWLADGSSGGVQEPSMTFYFGTVDGVANGEELQFPLNELSDNQGFNSQRTEYTFDVEANDIESKVNSSGKSFSSVQYVTYNFAFQSDITLKSNKRYRFRSEAKYDQENESNVGEDQRNRWNPTYLPYFSDGASGGSASNPILFASSFPSDGPYVSLNVVGNQVASSQQSNALNFPFWDFVAGDTAQNAFFYYNNMSDPDSNGSLSLIDTPQNPGVGRAFWSKASGSLNNSTNQNWYNLSNYATTTVTQPNNASVSPSSTSGKGDTSGVTFEIQSSNSQILSITKNINTQDSGFVVGDTLTFDILDLEQAGFGTVNQDLIITLDDPSVVQNRRGSNFLTINKTGATGLTGLQLYADRIISIGTGAGADMGKMLISGFGNWEGDISNVIDNGVYYTFEFFNDFTNGGNSVGGSGYNNPTLNNDNSSDSFTITFTTGSESGDVTLADTTIELSSSNGNNSYGLGYYQGYLPYTASENNNFPGGMEPQDTAWPLPNVPYEFRINDEIRFQNDERFAYKIVKVLSPQQNFMLNGVNKLRLTVDRPIQTSIDLNFFLIRRYVDAPNSVIVDRVFPYGSLPTVKEFVPSSDQILAYNDDTGPSTGAAATGSTTIMENSGSFVEYIKPLLKSDNTPTAILKPEFPTVDIDVAPDAIIRELRDKKLIN